MIKKLLLAKFNIIIFLLFAFSGKVIGQTSTSGGAYIWSTATSWTPTGVPTNTTDVTVNNSLTLDQNLTIGTGNYTFNQDVTDQPGGSDYNLTNLDAAGSLTIASGTTTIGGVTDIGGNATFTLTVKNGATLVLGTPGSTSNNFLIGNKVAINIESGGTMIVYGNILNSNSSGTFTVNGLLQVYGDYKTDNGNLNINGTTGQFYTTGGMQTQGSSTIYGSGNECVSNCSGTSLGCGSSGNSYTAIIAPQSQTVCSGGVIATMTFTTNAPSPTYQWQYSLTAGGNYSDVSEANSSSYTPSALTVTRWYRVKYTSTSCSGPKYSAPIPVYVSASTYTQSTAGQTVCGGTFGPISVSAFGTALTYQWYSNTTASNSGGSLISGATSNVYTPSSVVGGIKYYYCVINSSCGVPFTTAISGAFTVNLNSAGAASSSPTPCVNTLMTSITHTTTGTTGIGIATALPTGVSASWVSNTITISGTPTASGTFSYSIPLTGGCGSVNATGTITVNAISTIVLTSGTQSPTVCAGTAITNTVYTFSGSATSASVSGLPAGLSQAVDTTAKTVTISGTPTAGGTYTITSSGHTAPCTAATISGTVTVNALPNNITNGFSATTICAGGSPQLTFNAEDSSFSTPYSITYKNDATSIQYTIAIPSASAYSFTPADNPTSNTGYTLVSISNAFCTTTTGFVNSGASLIVRPMPTATISGTTSVCVGDSYPNITFTNPQTVAITITYTINGGTNQTIDIAASGFSNIAVATTTAGAFVYNLVSVVYQSNPNCSNALSGSATVTVNPNLPTSVSILASPSGAICSGTSVTFTASPTNGGTAPSYQWKLNGGNVGSDSTTYTNAALANGDVVTCVMTSNATPCLTGSPANSNSSIITVNPLPTAPIAGTLVQPTCVLLTGSVVLSGLPASGTWTINPGGYTGTGTTTTISGLAADTYNFTVSNGSCSSGTVNVIINPVITNTWTTSWSNGTPTSLQVIVFNENFSSTADLEACSCQATNGANVVINGGHTLKVTNAVVVVSGSLTFENNASLVQVNDFAVNSGNIIYKRTTTPIFNTDYVYWSSPVVGFTLGGITTGTLYYSFNGAANSWVRRYASTSMTAGMGYIVRGAGTGLATSSLPAKTVTFTGEPNNGVIKASIGGANTSNLIGNPYPSAIDANAFLTANTEVLEGTLYFWTHNIPIQLATNIANGTAGSGAYAYTSDDYATYNLTGPTVAVSGAPLPSGKIAAGQGFIATGFSAGDAVFNNSMRLSSGGAVLDNTQFFKQTRTSKTVAKVEKSRIWLNLTNAQGAFKQILVGYVAGATNAYDRAYDGVNYNGNKYVNFYSVNNTTNLTVQGRALPFDITDEVPLGYSSTIVGEFSISMDKTDGLFVSQDVFLEDKLLNVIHDLKQTAYVFSSDKGQFNERFVLRYKEKELDAVSLSAASGKVLISNKNKQVKVNSLTSDLIDKVFVYDVTGRILYKKENVNSSEFSLINIVSKNQMLLVKSVLQNGQVVISKIIY